MLCPFNCLSCDHLWPVTITLIHLYTGIPTLCELKIMCPNCELGWLKRLWMSEHIELSSSFTHFFNKSLQAAAYSGVEHTFKTCLPYVTVCSSMVQKDSTVWTSGSFTNSQKGFSYNSWNPRSKKLKIKFSLPTRIFFFEAYNEWYELELQCTAPGQHENVRKGSVWRASESNPKPSAPISMFITTAPPGR